MRPPLLLTGAPAVGKNATSARLASTCRLAAVIDVDDIRHLVVAGHAAPWEGSAGRTQQQVGVQNATDLARRFLDNGIDVVLADVVNDGTLPIYRRRLPGLAIIRLTADLNEARRRATLRPLSLTEQEFADLHEEKLHCAVTVDHTIDVTTLTLDQQTTAVLDLWPT